MGLKQGWENVWLPNPLLWSLMLSKKKYAALALSGKPPKSRDEISCRFSVKTKEKSFYKPLERFKTFIMYIKIKHIILSTAAFGYCDKLTGFFPQVNSFFFFWKPFVQTKGLAFGPSIIVLNNFGVYSCSLSYLAPRDRLQRQRQESWSQQSLQRGQWSRLKPKEWEGRLPWSRTETLPLV